MKAVFGDLIPRSDKHTQKLLSRITDSMDMGLSKLLEVEMDREAWRAVVHGGPKELDTTERPNYNSNR